MNRRIEIIYVVDDDDIYQYAVKKKILKRKLSAEVNTFKNGKDAILHLGEVVKTGGPLPDVIFLDLNMPIMDGWEFLDEFGKLSKENNIRIYILSSSVDSRDIERAKNYGMVNGFIAKPLTDAKIKELAQEIAG